MQERPDRKYDKNDIQIGKSVCQKGAERGQMEISGKAAEKIFLDSTKIPELIL